MKFVLIAAMLVVTTLLAHAEPLYTDTANNLAELCRDWDTGAPTFEKGLCAGYINGVRDETTNECEGPNVTKGQLIKVVVKYMNDHPEQLNESAAKIIHEALSKAFPCNK